MGQEHDPAGTSEESRPLAALVFAALLAPLVLRGVQISEVGAAPGLGDLRGALADLGIAFGVAALLGMVLVPRPAWLGRTVAGLGLVIWIALNNANLEHVRTLGTMLSGVNAAYLFDGTFLRGSALQLSHPLLVAALLVASLGALAAAGHRARRRRSLGALVLVGFAALGIRATLPSAADAASWRQTSFVIDNLRWLTTHQELVASGEPIPGLFPGDLRGTPRTRLGHAGQNVLLVVLEGISGAYLDRIATQHGLEGARPRLPSLDAALDGAYTLTNFVNQQRQTNRGLYALVCGDLPKLTTSAPKMTELGMSDGDALCLPQALRRNGYQTAFLQAAPLDFMAKDKFMPRAGFARFHGTEWFRNSRAKGAWGVDDREFLERSLELIAELQQDDAPWFLTLLSSGTHHPFMVPPDFESAAPPNTFGRAVDYLDLGLESFLAALERAGVRDDTLVLLTSDESFGLEGDLDDDSMMLSQAWGFLAALLPSREKAEVRTPFSQTDVAISVLDYLGMSHEAAAFRGRSFFRSYPTARPVPFANTYMRMSGLVEDDETLLLCQEDRSSCRQYQLDDAPLLFAARTLRAEGDADPSVDMLGDITARSMKLAVLGAGETAQHSWPLVDTPIAVVLDSAKAAENEARVLRSAQATGRPVDPTQLMSSLFGHQYLSLAGGQQVTIDLVLEVDGDNRIALIHSLRAVHKDAMPSTAEYRDAARDQIEELGFGPSTLGMRPRFITKAIRLGHTERIVAGHETFELRYSFSTAEDLERLNAQLWVRPLEGDRTRVVLREATLRIDDLEEGSEARGLKIHRYSHSDTGRRRLASGAR